MYLILLRGYKEESIPGVRNWLVGYYKVYTKLSQYKDLVLLFVFFIPLEYSSSSSFFFLKHVAYVAQTGLKPSILLSQPLK
jgi:hypothetical protein